jgi:dephospho-CoA kinase
MSSKLVIVFAGLMGSGKDSAAFYLRDKYSASIYSFSTMLEDAARRFYLEFNRHNLSTMSEVIRKGFGEDILAKTMARDIEKDPNNIIVVSNARRLADVEFLSQFPNYVLCEIYTDLEVRYARLVQRGQRTDDKTKTFEEFKKDQSISTELTIPELIKQATERINNNGSVENFHKQLDELVKKYIHE